jgi:hypothetical protein
LQVDRGLSVEHQSRQRGEAEENHKNELLRGRNRWHSLYSPHPSFTSAFLGKPKGCSKMLQRTRTDVNTEPFTKQSPRVIFISPNFGQFYSIISHTFGLFCILPVA